MFRSDVTILIKNVYVKNVIKLNNNKTLSNSFKHYNNINKLNCHNISVEKKFTIYCYL